MNHLDLEKKLKQKARVKRQDKRRVSPNTGTLSRQLQHLALVEKRQKIKTRVKVELKAKK